MAPGVIEVAETSKNDPGWWQHCFGAAGLGLIVLALYRFNVSQAWVFTVMFGLIWPMREFVQNGSDMMRGRSLAEWLPATSIIVASDIAGRVFL